MVLPGGLAVRVWTDAVPSLAPLRSRQHGGSGWRVELCDLPRKCAVEGRIKDRQRRCAADRGTGRGQRLAHRRHPGLELFQKRTDHEGRLGVGAVNGLQTVDQRVLGPGVPVAVQAGALDLEEPKPTTKLGSACRSRTLGLIGKKETGGWKPSQETFEGTADRKPGVFPGFAGKKTAPRWYNQNRCFMASSGNEPDRGESGSVTEWRRRVSEGCRRADKPRVSHTVDYTLGVKTGAWKAKNPDLLRFLSWLQR